MGIYLIASIVFFSMLYALIYGFYELVRKGFWGYHERIIQRIQKYEVDAKISGQDEMMIGALKKQQKELEDIMGQYVFFRFCERLSGFLIQSDMAILFCASLATVIFAHSAIINKEFIWLGIWLACYITYAWIELTGEFVKFEVWATNLFLKQYKSLNSVGGGSIVDAKKGNKTIIRKLYMFFILPVSVVSMYFLFKNIFYPLLPMMDTGLQWGILKLWFYFIFFGILFVAAIPSFLDRVLNAKIRFTPEQLYGSLYAAPIYLFLSLMMAIVISIAKYSI
jgi:hypothetical protein